MPESEKHKYIKECAARIFGGQMEQTVNGRVDVMTPEFYVEVETTGRTDRIEHAAEKISSSKSGGGFLIVPQDALQKTNRLIADKDNVIAIPSDKFEKICRCRDLFD